jgi:hypothetical protein
MKMNASQITHNAVTSAILALDLGTDSARVARTIRNGGQPLVDTLGAFLSVEALQGMNQKAVMRAVQAVSFAVSGSTDDLDPVTASVISAVMLSSDACISFESMRYAAGQTGILDPKSIGGVSRAKLMRFIGRGGTAKTIESKVSRSVGKRGFLTGLGVTEKSDAHTFTLREGARASGFVLGYAHQLQTMTDGAFALVFEDK